MPVGGGDIGVNAWVEEGELLLYMDRSGFFDENNTMLKPGRVRVAVEPNPFVSGTRFRQTLDLESGRILIAGRTTDGHEVTVVIWVEVFRPVIHVEIESDKEVRVTAQYENWRTEKRIHQKTWNGQQKSFAYLFYDGDVFTSPDVIETRDDGVWFYHRNPAETIFDIEVERQHLSSVKDQLWNPMKNRTFGGVLFGKGFKSVDTTEGVYGVTPYRGWRLESTRAQTSHRIHLALHQAQTDTAAEWLDQLTELKHSVPAGTTAAREQQRRWWTEFWRRGFVAINPRSASPADIPWQIGRNYQLVRFMQGCNSQGSLPTKFNGHLFTVDPMYSNLGEHRFNFVEGAEKMAEETPDFRMWGGGSFTAQNQRLVYWPMIKNGDEDLMRLQFDFYKNGLDNATLRTRVYWGHDGASFTEQMNFYGLPLMSHYGWDRPKALPPGDDQLLRYLWVNQLEFAYMILEYRRFLGTDISAYLPFVLSSLNFFDQHYQYRHRNRTGTPLDEQGKLVIAPSIAAETYLETTNPIDVVAGMTAVAQSLLELPDGILTAEQRDSVEALQTRLPGFAVRSKDGKKVIAPAHKYDVTKMGNEDFPQLYTVFPYHIHGLGKPDLDLAINTWHYGFDAEKQKNSHGWHQGVVFCARMGLTDEAAERITAKLSGSKQRFPAFFGPDFDWLPDMNKAGVGMIGLQEMLLQTAGREIRLLPAWPREWNVHFRLHAPFQTVVEVIYRDGVIEKLEVNPESRAKEVILPEPHRVEQSVATTINPLN